jgi:hypothetical protein
MPTPKSHAVLSRRPPIQQFNSHVRLVIVSPNGSPGHFDAMCGNEMLVLSSRQPFLDAARVLESRGADTNGWLIGRHAGSDVDAVRGKVGVLARLTVSEEDNRPPRFKRWKPRNLGEGSPPIARAGSSESSRLEAAE